MSLKKNLQQIIRDRHGEVFTLKELEDFCHKAQYKTATAERRLRKSESPDIEPVWNNKHTAIIGYQTQNSVPTDENQPCCYSYSVFKTHTKDCPIFNELEKQAKILEAKENQPNKLL